MPDEWLISRICEEFHIPPSVAREEWDNDDGTILRIVHLRGFAAAKQELDRAAAQSREIENPSPLMRQVMEIEFGLMKADMERRKREREAE